MTIPTLAQTDSSPNEISFLRLISTGIATKLIIDSGFQIFNPFLPIIATGLGADLLLVRARDARAVQRPAHGFDQGGFTGAVSADDADHVLRKFKLQ